MGNPVKDLGDGWGVTVAKTFEQVEDLRQIWQNLQNNGHYPVPNADIDRYLSVLKPQDGQMQPYVMLFRQRNNPVAMVVGRLERYELKCKVGYKVIWNPLLRCLTVVYGGILCGTNENTCSVLIKYLQSVLQDGVADMVFFNQLRIDSSFYQLVRNIPSWLCRGHFPNVLIHRSQSIPGSIDSFYQKLSKKHRANMRRAVRKLEKEYSEKVEIARYSCKDDIEDLMKAVSTISKGTYQHAMGLGFADDLPTRHLMARSADLGMLRAYVLFVEGRPCAFQLLTRYGSTYFLDRIGYDPAWKSWNVGTVLFIKALEDICRASEADCLDFLFGDAEYKRHYADKKWFEASVYIFAPRFYPVLINVVDTAIRCLSLSLSFVLQRLGVTAKAKKYWRELLKRKGNSQ